MKVSLICPNLGGNAFGRTYILAKALSRVAEVNIVGISITDPPVWPVFDTGEFDIKHFRARGLPKFVSTIPHMVDALTGDIVYACKPLPASLWPALTWKKKRGGKIWLDIDDDEYGKFRGLPFWLRWLAPLDTLRSVSHTRSVRFGQPLVGQFDRITVSSGYLKERYGGTVVPHGRDTDAFNPEDYDRAAIRTELGIEDEFVVLFQGTPRIHKGLGMLVTALEALLERMPVRFILVGAGADHPEARRLLRMAPRLLAAPEKVFLGQQPFERVPYYLAAADLVALPQDDSPFSRGQLPAKVFDAMAMARPIVAGAVSDIPDILDGCGQLVPPGDAQALENAIYAAWADPELRNKNGKAARKRCVERYSIDRMARTFQTLLNEEERG